MYVDINYKNHQGSKCAFRTTSAVIRDDRGEFIDACNWKIYFCHDVVSAEATALRYGLSLEQTIGCNKIIVNSDNIEVVSTMNEGGRSAGPAATVFDDCYHIPWSFSYTSFVHSSREANSVAHELANLTNGPSCNSVFC